jgi:formylglycine-generating enzyme required for sulfatase activity
MMQSSSTKTRRRLQIVWSILLVVLVIWGIIFAFDRLPKLMPLGSDLIALARGGVTENADWQPVIKIIGGVEMALVPAGCFMMGSTDEQLEEAFDSCDTYYAAFGCQQSFEDEQPAHQVCITAPFWIDLTAVTNSQYGSSSNQGEAMSPYRGSSWPRETITWQEAVDFCDKRTVSLPTEAEWEFAARGPDSLIYPFGNQYDIYKVTLYKLHPAPVGQIPEGASWVGALDMSGGIAEWVADWYGAYTPDEQTNPSGSVSGELRIARGGS